MLYSKTAELHPEAIKWVILVCKKNRASGWLATFNSDIASLQYNWVTKYILGKTNIKGQNRWPFNCIFCSFKQSTCKKNRDLMVLSQK